MIEADFSDVGYNDNLLAKSEVLRGYMYFVNQVKKYHVEDSILINDAIELAIRDCIDNNVLANFFHQRKEEVKGMALDFTWEAREELIREEEYEAGKKCGIEQERKATLERMLQADIPTEQIMACGYTREEISKSGI